MDKMLPVTRSDQNDINQFSLLSTKALYHMDLIDAAKKMAEIHRDALAELDAINLAKEEAELFDEDFDGDAGEPVPKNDLIPIKCGTAFIHVTPDRARRLCLDALKKAEKEAEEAHSALDLLQSEISSLKSRLYAKFGDTIQLELDPKSSSVRA